jgi:filamentous hemagglutinin family protein
MNKHLYRIIFNAKRGIRMAVAETAASQGKAASGEANCSPSNDSESGSCIAPVLWTLTTGASLVAFCLLVASPVQAQVIADRSAPGNQQPTILSTASGVTQVNIQAPSAGGVSRNTYSQFDVGSKGVILNNSRTDTSTQIGGYVQANPWLATGGARVILNEVNSSNASQIRGYVEVAGQRAEVIIANPAGIAVSGGGFLNASAVTLTTGNVVMNAGNLDSFKVRGGTITIDGTGLDTSTADYTNILTRALQVNAGIWAKDLKVATGSNDISASSAAAPTATANPTAVTGPTPAFALDVASLGGMYAGKIHLIGTEAGLGIRNAGTIGASAGDVTVTNDGWISNTGSVYATGKTTLTAQGSINNTGTGLIAAGGNTTVSAQGAGSQVSIASGATIAAGMSTTGAIGSTGNLTVSSADTTTVQGQLATGGDMALNATSLVLDNAKVSGQNIQLTASASDLSAKQATVTATETLSATTQTRLVTDGATVTAKQLNLAAHDLSNIGGTVQQSGTGDTTITLAGSLDNTNGKVAVNSNQLNLSVHSLNNNAGTIAGNGSLVLTVATDTTNTGSILANKDLSVSTTANLTNTGKVQAGQSLAVSANTLDNAATGELSSTATTLNATGSFSNRGLVDSGNTAGTGSTRIQAATVNNLGTGRIYGDKVGIAATTLNNDAETVAGVTKTATIAARDRLDIGATTINNSQGANILSVGDMALGGSLDANGQATGRADTVNNSASTIESFGAMRIAAATINNLNLNLQWASDAGTQSGSGTVYFTQAGTFDTATGGLLSTTAPLTPQAHGGYAYATSVTAACNTVSAEDSTPSACVGNPQGTYTYTVYDKGQAQANSTSSPSTFDGFAEYTQTDYKPVVSSSTPGRIASGGNMMLDATQTVVNDQSVIVAGGALNITAPVDNRARSITLNSVRSGTAYNWDKFDSGCGNDLKGCDYRYYAYRPSAYSSTIAKTYTLDSAVQRQFVSNAVTKAEVGATNLTGAGSGVTSVSGTTSLPNSSLFTINSNPASHYLVETDPRFTNYRAWLSSDYITTKLALDPTVTQKRLGDGFYEQKLIREQVAQLTGRRFLGDYTSDQQQYQALMDSGLTFAKAYNLRPGIALTANQLALLTTDIVWLQQETVTLADGTKTQVLVPHVYAAVKAGDLSPKGGLLGGDSVAIQTTGDITNAGTILGRKVVQIEAGNIHNLAGLIQAQDLALQASQDINNTGGTVMASNSLVALAGRDLNVTSTTASSSGSSGAYSYSQTGIDRVAGLYVQGKGVLYASAGNNINLTAAEMAGNGAVQLDAGNNVNINALKTSQTNNFNAGEAKNHLLTSQTSDAGSTISAGTNLTVNAGNSIAAKAASLSAADTVTLAAKGNIVLDTGQTQSSYESVQTSTSSGLLSSTTTSTQTQASSATAQVSTISAKNISVIADQSLVSVGTEFKGSGSVYVEGKDTTTLYAATNTRQSTTTTQSTTTLGAIGGVLGNGFTLEDKTSTDSQASASSIGTKLISNEKVTIGVGNKTELQGTDIQSPQTSFVKTDPSKAGELILGASKDTTQIAHTEKSETAGVWQEQKGQGSTTQTLNQTKISGNVSFDNALKITVQIPGTKGGQELKSQIQALAGQNTGTGTSTGLEYLNTLAQRTDINWDKVALAHENWSYSQAGLTPAGAALLTIAVAAGTGGMGAGLTGTTGALGTAMSAGFSSLASQAAVSLVNNGGDIGKTLEALGKEESIKNLLLTMATAGALDKLNANYFKGIDAKSSFIDQLQKNLSNNIATDLMNSALAGKPFDENTLANSLKGALINTGTAQGANAIGDGLVNNNLNNFTHKLAHAVLGCAGAEASGGDCRSGAVGAVVGELAAEYINPTGDPALKDKTIAFAKTLAAVAGVITGGGGDNAAAVNTAATAGANAAENNYLKHSQWTKLAEKLNSCQSEAECAAVRKEFAALSAKQDAELNKACEDINSAACRSQLAEVQAGTLKQKELANVGKLPDYYLAGSDLNASANLISKKAILADVRSACDKDPNCTAKKQEALVKVASLALDFTPVIGDVKGFLEAETPFDFVLATLGTIGGPVGDSLVKVLREGKAAYKAGDVAAAAAKLEEAKTMRNVMDQTAVVPSLSGNISKAKLTNEAIAVPTPKIMGPAVEDIRINGDITGLKTENLVNVTLLSDPGMVVLEGTKYNGNKGLDHVVQFVDPQTNKLMTMVIDSKQLAKNGSTSLDPQAAGGVMQLSDSSLNVVMNSLGESSPAVQAIRQANADGTLIKAVAYVDKTTGQLKVVPVNVPNRPK